MVGFLTYYGDPVLRTVCPEIKQIDEKIVSLSKRMRFFMQRADGVGLAGTQIGTDKNLFVYNIGKGFDTVINPVIIDKSEETIVEPEGCLSVPGFYFAIARSKEVVLEGQDLDGNDLHLHAEGLLARLFQHEVDHLQGCVIVDLLDKDQKNDFIKKWRHKKKR